MIQAVEIRRACAEDVEDIQRLEQASSETPHWSMEKYHEILRQSGGALWREVWVAVVNDMVVGFAVVAVLLDEAEMESISVDCAQRRLGVGRALMDSIYESIRLAGVKELRLEVRKSNETAQCFYKSLGFVASGARRSYYSDPVEDAVLMCQVVH